MLSVCLRVGLPPTPAPLPVRSALKLISLQEHELNMSMGMIVQHVHAIMPCAMSMSHVYAYCMPWTQWCSSVVVMSHEPLVKLFHVESTQVTAVKFW